MRKIWSVNLAKKYPHLPWALLNEPSNIGVLKATEVLLLAPVVLQILGPKVAQGALNFITDSTIQVLPVNKVLVAGKPSSPAIYAVCRAVKQASWILKPAIAASHPTTTTTSIQTLLAITQHSPPAATTISPAVEATAITKMLHPINNDVSIMDEAPTTSGLA
uniref:Uncharacterized protein n=1 Tax=Romanomermis culicivorax TaxID=13658 RepID=A0A915KQT3_ROMCU